MRNVLLPIILLLMAGCRSYESVEHQTLMDRYRSSVFADGVVSTPPAFDEREGAPPTVVNWYYAGTRRGTHRIVERSLTWDAGGNPIGRSAWYTIRTDELEIAEQFKATDDASGWAPLWEASPDFERPPDLPTVRELARPETEPEPVPAEAVDPPGS